MYPTKYASNMCSDVHLKICTQMQMIKGLYVCQDLDRTKEATTKEHLNSERHVALHTD